MAVWGEDLQICRYKCEQEQKRGECHLDNAIKNLVKSTVHTKLETPLPVKNTEVKQLGSRLAIGSVPIEGLNLDVVVQIL